MAHILIADDDPIIRRLLAHILERQDHTFEAVEDGREALDAVQSRAFDLLLIDLDLPELTGIDVTSRIRRTGSPLPIVMLTASGLEGDEDAARRAGVSAFLTKPFSSRGLRDQLADLLG